MIGLLRFVQFQNSWHSLTGWIKLETKEVRWQVPLPELHIITAASENKLKHGLLGGTWIINSVESIAWHGLVEVCHYFWAGEFWRIEFFGECTIWIINFECWSTAPNIGPGHLVLCESSSLVGADVVGTSHCLTWWELFNEVLINKHLLNWVGKWDHDSEW